MVSFVTAYGDKVRARLVNNEPSMTKQSFKDECDINNILRKYNKQTGIEFMSHYAGYYGGKFEDVSAAVDLQEAYQQVHEATEAFNAMPASLRSRFNNDPVALLGFLGDPNNRAEAQELGLIQKVEAPKVADVSV